jgi:hypothetical protein
LRCAARTLGATDAEIFWRVIIPLAVPHMLTALRVSLGVAWATLVATELPLADGCIFASGMLLDSERAQVVQQQVGLGAQRLRRRPVAEHRRRAGGPVRRGGHLVRRQLFFLVREVEQQFADLGDNGAGEGGVHGFLGS